MNINDTVTATTTANVFSGVRRPWSSVVWTAIGWLIVESTVFERVRFWAAKVAKASVRCNAARSGPGG